MKTEKLDNLETDLAMAINRNGIDATLNTPDYILAAYLTDCLAAYANIRDGITKHDNC